MGSLKCMWLMCESILGSSLLNKSMQCIENFCNLKVNISSFSARMDHIGWKALNSESLGDGVPPVFLSVTPMHASVQRGKSISANTILGCQSLSSALFSMDHSMGRTNRNILLSPIIPSAKRAKCSQCVSVVTWMTW